MFRQRINSTLEEGVPSSVGKGFSEENGWLSLETVESRRKRRSTKDKEQFRTVQIRAKKTWDKRGPEQSKVKQYHKTSLWLMCCAFVKRTTVVITVNIPIKSRTNPELTNYCRGNLTRDNILQVSSVKFGLHLTGELWNKFPVYYK
jgi:hypothetical protein